MSTVLSPNFYIGTIRIGAVEGASCVNLGNNWPTDFDSYKKQSQGFGEISGDHNQLTSARTGVTDSDFLDMLNVSDSSEIPEWLRDVITDAFQATTESHKEDDIGYEDR